MRLIPPVWYAAVEISSKGEVIVAPQWRYRIRVEGWLSERWMHWFEEMDVDVHSGPVAEETTLAGTVADQAALFGVLQHLYTLGLPILLVEREAEGDVSDVPRE
jgi:hypothetical protein